MENTVTREVEKTGGGYNYRVLVNGTIWAGGFISGVKLAEKRAHAECAFMYDKVVASLKAVR